MRATYTRPETAAARGAAMVLLACVLLAGPAGASPGTVADQRAFGAEQDVWAATGTCHWHQRVRHQCLHQRNHKRSDPQWLRAHLGHRESFLRFSLPKQERTTEAWLRLTAHVQHGDTVVRLVDDNSWSEHAVTFERKPGVGRDVCVIPHWVPWNSPFMCNITDIVNARLSATQHNKLSLALQGRPLGGESVYFSKDHPRAVARPLLLINSLGQRAFGSAGGRAPHAPLLTHYFARSVIPTGTVPDREHLYAVTDGFTQNSRHHRHNFARTSPGLLQVWRHGAEEMRAFMRFPRPFLGVTSGQAKLTLHIDPASGALPVDVTVYGLDERSSVSWDQHSLTWDNSPVLERQKPVCTLPRGATGAVSCDITPWMVQREMELLKTGGFVALGLASAQPHHTVIRFASSTTLDINQRPKIQLTYRF